MSFANRFLALGLIVLAGCSGGGDDKSVVRGEVMLDGKEPLKKGMIRFLPLDAKHPPAEAEIIDGKYEVRVPPGEARVEISAPKVIGKLQMAPDSPPVDEIDEALPARFNSKSTLTYTVQKGTQEKRFDVQSR